MVFCEKSGYLSLQLKQSYIAFPCTKACSRGNSLVVQWLKLHTPNAGGPGSIPGQGTRSRMPQVKILHATTKNPACHNQDPAQPNQSILKKKKKKQPTKSQPANKGWQSQHPIPPSAPVLQCHWAHRHTVGSP